VNHAEKYVEGNVHTNGMENFWSLLNCGLKGTYVSVEPFHLFQYLDEQAFLDITSPNIATATLAASRKSCPAWLADA
jgi:ISXO2-like transposase domain